jgi:hypothetical protein
MATPTNLKIDGVNFQQIRENFKNYLKNQEQFKDYNFDAAGIATLLDILSFNTYYNSFYVNMVATESNLNTAQRRNSIVNLAGTLNYVPRSTTAAKIEGTLKLTVTGSPSSITLPQYTRFDAVYEGTTYSFLTQEPFTFTSGTDYTLSNIELIQGRHIQEKYIVNTNNRNQRFLINNVKVDTSTLLVRVQTSSTISTLKVFENPLNTIINVNETVHAYFLKEVEDGKYEVTFGDGIIGIALSNQNIVILDYIVTEGAEGNQIREITLSSTVENVEDALFTANNVSAGGEDRESAERIKFAAPKFYTAQNRAVTVEDYRAILLTVSNVGSVSVWGGEDNDPPFYGKVFIAIKPVIGEQLTNTEKNNIIRTILKNKKILTIQNEIIDPEFIFIVINAEVKYDPEQTIATEDSVKSKILNTIKLYNDTDINQFSKYLRYSKLSRLIDTCERSILSCELTLSMYKKIDVQLNAAAKYTINFSNSINSVTIGRPVSHPFSSGSQITSNEFSYGGFNKCFLDENNGIIRIYRVSGNQNLGVTQNVGTINYTTGVIVLTDFRPTAFADGGVTLKIFATPLSKDILPLRGQIIRIRDEDIVVNLINDKTISLVKR